MILGISTATIAAFVLGACLGGAGIGWLFWNKKAKIQAELDALRSRIGA